MRERETTGGIDLLLLFCLTTYQSFLSLPCFSLLFLPSLLLSHVSLRSPSSPEKQPRYLLSTVFTDFPFAISQQIRLIPPAAHPRPSVRGKTSALLISGCPPDKKFVCSFSRRDHLPGLRVSHLLRGWRPSFLLSSRMASRGQKKHARSFSLRR